MTQKLSATDAVAKVQRQELVRVIRNLARHSTWQIEQAFEKLACSCRPQREELKDLEAERERRLSAAKKEIDQLLSSRIERLRGEIAHIDWLEHPQLDAMGRRAAHFFALWIMERVGDGDTELFDEESELRATRFAETWLNGWRPSFPA